jgi:hypothetical protein
MSSRTTNGLRCTATPCLNFNSRLANRSRDHTVSSFDLSKLALTAEQWGAFQRAVDGGQEVLIQLRHGQTIGTDVREGVLGLFMPAASVKQPPR